MKNIIIVFVLMCTQVISAQDSEWILQKDLDRGFRADFPGKVSLQSQPIQTAVGEVTMDMYMLDKSADLSAANLIYMVAFTAYPEDSDYSDEGLQNSMLDGSVSGAVNNIKGELKSSENIKFNGYNARDAFIAIQGGAYTVHLRNILVENKLYLIQTITETAKSGNDKEKQFFDSFELIKTN